MRRARLLATVAALLGASPDARAVDLLAGRQVPIATGGARRPARLRPGHLREATGSYGTMALQDGQLNVVDRHEFTPMQFSQASTAA